MNNNNKIREREKKSTEKTNQNKFNVVSETLHISIFLKINK